MTLTPEQVDGKVMPKLLRIRDLKQALEAFENAAWIIEVRLGVRCRGAAGDRTVQFGGSNRCPDLTSDFSFTLRAMAIRELKAEYREVSLALRELGIEVPPYEPKPQAKPDAE